MDRPDDRCAMVAAEQHGCISLAQARRCGLSADAVRRRVARRRWSRLLPEVYALAGSPATWEQRLSAALLWAGDDAALSGPSASALWGLPGFRPGPVEVAGCPGRRSRPGVVVRRTPVEPAETTFVRAFRVTTPERTLADLASRLSQDAFDAAFHHCLHARLTTLTRLREVADRRTGQPGAARFRRTLDLYDGDRSAPASVLEGRWARRLQRAGLPAPRRQFEVRVASGRRYVDFAWPDRLVGLEIDGYRWHSSRRAWRSDRIRLAELRRAGWTILHATAEDVNAGAADVIGELRSLLTPRAS